MPHRYAIVGAGARAQLFARALATTYADRSRLVAFADPNPARIAAHNRALTELGAPPATGWPADRFAELLTTERPDTVIVTSVDRTHDEYIVAALQAGCDVITEKPMTVDVAGCQRILQTVADTGRRVAVTFNYRYNPLHERVKELLSAGTIGEVGSVHFEWLLDVRHGADYFRRWHREKANSGGLLVHKATHHFDLVNWWLAAHPVEVYASGRLFFYGEHGQRHGYDRGYDRAHGSAAAESDPFALRMADSPQLQQLYLDAEAHDGYHRDRNVFAPGVTIEDDLSVLVRYDSGARMTYHLTAYSPWEGYRVMFNGSQGRLELEVVENDHVAAAAGGGLKGAQLHGDAAAAEAGGYTLTVRPFWRPPYQVDVPDHQREGHGGADSRMTDVLFGAEPGRIPDRLGRAATERDGAASLLVGFAGNVSLERGAPVRTSDLLDLSHHQPKESDARR
ncbi:Gfo/Idh/MocA family oxidoreductase [Natronosporangium hydrolyticum]|uniref:Gfo/Idh/MocA family oxidoreductase n=1 Tax=Natronosporangium hydrolyticum TaxID=2811111 RepID=A0A895YP93_9ACTN|nr:Gfo/Idh/MocA family oxidoreductase [Natronosporangium hydrolyticum]QSB15778.1 Gfo/Idh/MocA family oxidoreductase [Natronosporangium hydrolyticum]